MDEVTTKSGVNEQDIELLAIYLARSNKVLLFTYHNGKKVKRQPV